MTKKKKYKKSILLKICIISLLVLLAGCKNQEQKQNQNIQHIKMGSFSKDDITSFKLIDVRLIEKDVPNKADRDKIIDIINSVKIIKKGVESADGIGYGVSITYSNGEKFRAMYLPVSAGPGVRYFTMSTAGVCYEVDKNVMEDLMAYYSNIGLTENKAISMVIKEHKDFPSSQSEVITKELPIGGPKDSTAKVKFTTKVEKVSDSTYVVILTKDWGITVNGKYVESSWKYKVTEDSVTLLESNDNDDLINIIK